jgi:hypothetical protein
MKMKFVGFGLGTIGVIALISSMTTGHAPVPKLAPIADRTPTPEVSTPANCYRSQAGTRFCLKDPNEKPSFCELYAYGAAADYKAQPNFEEMDKLYKNLGPAMAYGVAMERCKTGSVER